MNTSQSKETNSPQDSFGVEERDAATRKDQLGNEQLGFCPQHIERFRQLYQEQFGVWLRESEAQRQLKSLVAVVRYQQQSYQRQNRLSPEQSETP